VAAHARRYHRSVRVKCFSVRRWRNLVDLHVDVPAEARFVCLVGENGTGKSSVLELIAWAAHYLGLAPQLPLRRSVPQPIPGLDFGVEVTLITDLAAELKPLIVERSGWPPEVVEPWNGDITLAVRSWAGETVPPVPPGTGYSGGPDGGQYIAVVAEGCSPDMAAAVGSNVVQLIRELPDLLHLYIDAERVFPPAEVQDQEILALARQDTTLPEWLKNQAAQITQNLYLEWMRSMLGQQQRRQTDYFQDALRAGQEGLPLAPPPDPLVNYRRGLAQVLPHLKFVRLDQDRRRLIFDSAGEELPYEDLSGGERELAFLVGQIDRFGVRDGLFLLDEPELHLNAELLRGWVDYLRSTVGNGQAWVATHSLEAAEIAGPAATVVLERDDDRRVRRAAPLAARPALTTLAAAVGTPAFSIARSRFVLIEGTRERRERERFAIALDTSVADRFIEADGCEEVIQKMRLLRNLASEEEQLRVAAVVDRDFRTDEQRARLLSNDDVYVMGLHEIENFFLQPALIQHLLREVGRSADEALALLQAGSDDHAGTWSFEKAKTELEWREDARGPTAVARTMTWSVAQGDTNEAARRIAETIPGVEGSEKARRRIEIRRRLDEYGDVRAELDRLARMCFGKETLASVSRQLGFRDASAVEARAAVLWRDGTIPRPAEATDIRGYLDSVPVLGS
jgi:ABC-type sugar transport system ATPase subunit